MRPWNCEDVNLCTLMLDCMKATAPFWRNSQTCQVMLSEEIWTTESVAPIPILMCCSLAKGPVTAYTQQTRFHKIFVSKLIFPDGDSERLTRLEALTFVSKVVNARSDYIQTFGQGRLYITNTLVTQCNRMRPHVHVDSCLSVPVTETVTICCLSAFKSASKLLL